MTLASIAYGGDLTKEVFVSPTSHIASYTELNAENVGVTSVDIYLPKVGGPNVERRSNVSLVIH